MSSSERKMLKAAMKMQKDLEKKMNMLSVSGMMPRQDKVLNPVTGKMVNIGGKLGKQIMKARAMGMEMMANPKPKARPSGRKYEDEEFSEDSSEEEVSERKVVRGKKPKRKLVTQPPIKRKKAPVIEESSSEGEEDHEETHSRKHKPQEETEEAEGSESE